MISKKYRLTEREVKKVLQRGKPFFSYGIVLNHFINKLNHNRFSIVIGAKSVITNVDRNFFRRRFYDFVSTEIRENSENQSYDFVFVVKKQNKLNSKDISNFKNFEKDIKFLLSKILK